MSELDVDQKRALAIEAMEEMAKDAYAAGQPGVAAGAYEEAARLMTAHAENAGSEPLVAERQQKAEQFLRDARAIKEGQALQPHTSTGAPAPSGGDWQVTWTRAGGEGQPSGGPGAGWEPFSIAFSSSDPATPVVGWRRR